MPAMVLHKRRDGAAMVTDKPTQRFQINVLGTDVVFRSRAEAGRITWAKDFVEEQYEKLKLYGRHFSKDQLLILLVMGIADDLLQSQQDLDEMRQRLAQLLSHIEETENIQPWGVRD